jgi:hypothetical protein
VIPICPNSKAAYFDLQKYQQVLPTMAEREFFACADPGYLTLTCFLQWGHYSTVPLWDDSMPNCLKQEEQVTRVG